MKILMLTRHQWLGASSRYRSIQYFPLLENDGWDVIHRPFFSDAYLRKKSGGGAYFTFVIGSYIRRFYVLLVDLWKADVVVVEKEVFPFLPLVFDNLLFLSRKPVVFDFDDAIWHAYERYSDRWFGRFFVDKIRKLVPQACHVIVGSEYLKQQMLNWGLNSVSLLPTTVTQKKYCGQGLVSHKNIDIVWIGSMTTGVYLLRLLPVLRRLNILYGMKIRLVGMSENIVPFEYSEIVEIINWSEETEVNLLSTARIGIMPVPDEPFERGKCGFKLIQYMGVGLPVVASPVGENQNIVSHGVTGFLANSLEDWFNCISYFYENPDSANLMGLRGYEKYMEKYSLECVGVKYLKLFREISKK